MAQQIRRIVTGHNAAGKSILAQDAIATSILELPAVPGLRKAGLEAMVALGQGTLASERSATAKFTAPSSRRPGGPDDTIYGNWAACAGPGQAGRRQSRGAARVCACILAVLHLGIPRVLR